MQTINNRMTETQIADLFSLAVQLQVKAEESDDRDTAILAYSIQNACSNLTESRREFQAADATIHNLELKLTDMAVQLANAESKCMELEAREVKPVAWMRNTNVTSFMSRFTTDEKYAVEQWGDDAVALYPFPVDFIPACFTDERNLMHINERGRGTSLIWSKQNSDSGDIKLFRTAAAGIGVKGE